MTLWLVRHGEADWPAGAALGWSDPPLSPAGEEQSRVAAKLLAARPLVAVHASDLRRARATAELVAAPHRLLVLVSPELRELDFGPWEGRRLADLWREHPADARAWEADLCRTPPQFGESVADLETRVARWTGVLRRAGEVAVVAHRGSLAALHALWTGGAFTSSWALGFELGEVRSCCS